MTARIQLRWLLVSIPKQPLPEVRRSSGGPTLDRCPRRERRGTVNRWSASSWRALVQAMGEYVELWRGVRYGILLGLAEWAVIIAVLTAILRLGP